MGPHMAPVLQMRKSSSARWGMLPQAPVSQKPEAGFVRWQPDSWAGALALRNSYVRPAVHTASWVDMLGAITHVGAALGCPGPWVPVMAVALGCSARSFHFPAQDRTQETRYIWLLSRRRPPSSGARSVFPRRSRAVGRVQAFPPARGVRPPHGKTQLTCQVYRGFTHVQ